MFINSFNIISQAAFNYWLFLRLLFMHFLKTRTNLVQQTFNRGLQICWFIFDTSASVCLLIDMATLCGNLSQSYGALPATLPPCRHRWTRPASISARWFAKICTIALWWRTWYVRTREVHESVVTVSDVLKFAKTLASFPSQVAGTGNRVFTRSSKHRAANSTFSGN